MTNLLEYDPDWKQKFWKNNPDWTIGEFLDMNAQMKAAKKRADESNNEFQGSEGTYYDKYGNEFNQQGIATGGKINDPLGIGKTILGMMGAWPAEVQRDKFRWNEGLSAGQQSAMDAASAAEAGTSFANLFGGDEFDPTSESFVDWDQ